MGQGQGTRAATARARTAAFALVAATTLVGLAPASASAASTPPPVRVEVLSSRADLVSGGDALVRVTLRRAADLSRLRVRVGRRNVTRAFARRANGRIEGLVTGIPNGRATLVAEVRGRYGTRLKLRGHPNGGPLISGPQLVPWGCPARAVDAQCNAPATYQLLAATSRGFVPYDAAAPPSGMRTTTTTDGVTVPFVVRVETGYQNRDQYRIATLIEPGERWEPWAPQRTWNRRIVVTHGGSCGTDRGAGSAPDVLNEELLGLGFLVTSTALNNLGHNCNPVVVAESELMVRERIVEQYGPVRATLGTGCSGGSISQLMIAHAYPGFYDGITIACTFADLFTTGKHALAGHLSRFFFDNLSLQGGELYTPLDQAAVMGSPLAVADDQVFDSAFWPAIDGSGGCKRLPAGAVRWSPATPDGVRCGVLDHNVNVLGRGPTGFAGIPFDNRGVQYGYTALQRGALSPAKFVDINARIGGFDTTSLARVPQRTAADPAAVRAAYRAGYLAIGNTLDQTPILEGRGSNEATAHVTYPTKILRERLRRQFGTHANHVLWEGPVPLLGNIDFANRMVLAMDRWVAAIQADDTGRSRARRIVANKPADLVDRCELSRDVVLPRAACPALVRYYDSPSQVAGEGLDNDVLQCAMKPLRREDYAVSFTDAQWATLRATFPDGVCDWSRPGVGEQPTVPWLTFRDGPGGKALGPPPRSRAFLVGRRR